MRRRNMLLSITLLFNALLLSQPLCAEEFDWPNWRGPFHNGATEQTGLPTEWDTQKNVKWSADLPGPGSSTPIVVGDRIFLTSFDTSDEQIWALALQRSDGSVLWKHPLGPGQSKQSVGRENHLAGPSPVSDGQRVVFLTGNGDLACFDMAGKQQWKWNVQERYGTFNYLWGYAASPLLLDGKLYINVLHRDYHPRTRKGKDAVSYLLCIDPESGEVIYKHDRPTDAPGESKEAYTTIMPFSANMSDKDKSLLILGGDYLTAHDPSTGEELSRIGTWNGAGRTHYRIVASAVAHKNIAIVCAPQGQPVYAYDIAGDKPRELWVNDDVTSDVATPLIYRGRLYILGGKKREVSCHDPATGEMIWKAELPGRTYIRASLTAADGKIYTINARGEAFCFAAGDEFRLLNETSMGDPNDAYPTYASIAIAHRCLFIRTADKLWCISAD